MTTSFSSISILVSLSPNAIRMENFGLTLFTSAVNYASFVSHCYANCEVGRGHRRNVTKTVHDSGLSSTWLNLRNDAASSGYLSE
jgi:hypothetical protein